VVPECVNNDEKILFLKKDGSDWLDWNQSEKYLFIFC